MDKIEVFGIIKNGLFECSKDSEIIETEYLRANEGKTVRKAWNRGKPSKTLQQLRFIRGIGFPQLADHLGYGDQQDLILYFKEMAMTDYKEVKSPHTGEVKRLKYYKSFAELNREEMSELIERFMAWCDDLEFPLRGLYIQYMGAGE